MVVDPELLEGLEAAVAASPDNVPLRLHLGLLLLRAGASVASAARPLAAEQPVAFEEGEPEESEELARGSHVATLLEDLGLEIEPAGVTLADVGGMTSVKQWLASAGPVPQAERSPRRRLQRALRGGLLEYGPGGCGKTFMAR